MRILIASSHRNIVGGVEKYLQALLPELVRHGNQIALAYEERFDPQLESIDGSEELPAWCLDEMGDHALLSSVAAWNPHVVYAHGLASPRVLRALLDAYPTVFYAHNYHGTCASGQKCHAIPRPQPCSRRFGPACLFLYYPRRCGGLHPGTMLQLYRCSREYNSQLQEYDAVLVASDHMYAEFERHGVNAEKLHRVPLPAPDSPQQTSPPVQRTPQGRVLFLGRLTKLKGGSYLIPALRQASQQLGYPLHLTVAGDGPERNQLESLARSLDVPAEFLGWVARARKVDFMRHADLVAVPSLWPEPFGLVGLEAGALGVPAAAYAVGGIPDWLIPGSSGELAPGDPPTVAGLADAIVRALGDPAHYAKLCRGAWEVSNRFNLANHLAKLEPLLETAAKRRSSRSLRPMPEGIHA